MRLVREAFVPQGDGRYQVRFRLFDTQKQVELGAMALPMAPSPTMATARTPAQRGGATIGQPRFAHSLMPPLTKRTWP